MPLDELAQSGRLRWETATRYYEAWIQQDLFGMVLIRAYGAKTSRRARLISWPGSQEALARKLRQVVSRRRSRGYTFLPTT